MGKTETIGIILITLVLFVWMYFNTPKQPPHTQQQTEQTLSVQGNNNNAVSSKESSAGKSPENTLWKIKEVYRVTLRHRGFMEKHLHLSR